MVLLSQCEFIYTHFHGLDTWSDDYASKIWALSLALIFSFPTQDAIIFVQWFKYLLQIN